MSAADDFRGRTAFVTGAASGIGLAIAQALAANGVLVALADRDLTELERATAGIGAAAMAVPLDVTDRSAWDRAKIAVEAGFGPVDILVNNAGIGPDGEALADMRPESFERMIAIKVVGTFNGIHTFASAMRDRGRGHIVNTASMAGLMSSPRLGAYTAAKFAVVGLSEVLAAELAPFGVGVSVLCPGLVQTRLRETTMAAGHDVIDLGTRAQEGIDAAIVAQAVIDAIRTGRLYVVTHGEYQSAVAGRMAAVVATFDGVPSRSYTRA
jgi:NAD(P)-dependent dehydrogenase (short-subunit alcohol dehydrogenase family)